MEYSYKKLWFETYDEHIMRLLLSTGFDVNTKDTKGCTKLFIAAKEDYDSVVYFLLNIPNIDVSIKNNKNESILQVTHDDNIKAKLIQAGAVVL